MKNITIFHLKIVIFYSRKLLHRHVTIMSIIFQAEENYLNSYSIYKNCDVLNNREELRHDFHNAHNEYILHIRASNRSIDEFQVAIPQVLEVLYHMSRVMRKPVFRVSDQVQHKLGYTAIEDF